MTAVMAGEIQSVLVTAKRAEELFMVKKKALRTLRTEVVHHAAERPVGRVRAIPRGARGWLYVAADIPLALAEDAMMRGRVPQAPLDEGDRQASQYRRAG